ncbi:hypothetical protein BU15DRAFT_79184 [Melanogaster broomeanus]|nr:hypothetical protein BU15DRAFT_79184 [Melanogaster broomeanus]
MHLYYNTSDHVDQSTRWLFIHQLHQLSLPTAVEEKHGSSSVPALSAQRGHPPPQSPPESVASTSDAGVQDSIAAVMVAPHPCALEHDHLDKLDILSGGLDSFRSAIIQSGRCKQVLQDILSLAHAGLMEFPDLTQRDFEVLSCFLEETNTLLEKPRMTYSSEERHLIVEWPSAIHEAPLEDLNIALTSTFPGLPYPRKAVRLTVALNFPIKTTKLTATPNAVIAMTSTRGPKKLRLPFIAECAFSQTCDSVFTKVKHEITAHPEVVMVLIVVINEVPLYAAPRDHSVAWERFKCDILPLELDAFIAACDEISEDVLKGPIVAAGHTWCNINSVDYYVWLKEEAVPINIADEDGEYSVHGTLPGNVNMDRVQILLNKGFELIKNSLVSFCKEIDPDADCTHLEQSDAALPPTWDHFLGGLANAAQITAHQRYITWYQDSFRGVKRSSRDSDYDSAPEGGSSSESNSALATEYAYPRTRARTHEMSKGQGR